MQSLFNRDQSYTLSPASRVDKIRIAVDLHFEYFASGLYRTPEDPETASTIRYCDLAHICFAGGRVVPTSHNSHFRRRRGCATVGAVRATTYSQYLCHEKSLSWADACMMRFATA